MVLGTTFPDEVATRRSPSGRAWYGGRLRAALPEFFEGVAPQVPQPDLRAIRQASEQAHVGRVVAACTGNLTSP